jgi:hypothetical protein
MHLAVVKERSGLQGKALYRAAAACYERPADPKESAAPLPPVKRKVRAKAKARAKPKTPKAAKEVR